MRGRVCRFGITDEIDLIDSLADTNIMKRNTELKTIQRTKNTGGHNLSIIAMSSL